MLDPCADPVLSAVERVTVEPVTGIEPALSDWEALRSARTVTCSLPRSWPTAVRGTGGDRVCPRIQVRSGTRMARATPCLQTVRPAVVMSAGLGPGLDCGAGACHGQCVAGSPSISPRKAPNSPTWVPSPRTSSATLPRPRRGSSCDDACSPMSWLASARWAVTTPRQLASAGGVSPSAGGAAKSTAINPADRPVDRTAVDPRTLEPPWRACTEGHKVSRRTGRPQAFPPRPKLLDRVVRRPNDWCPCSSTVARLGWLHA
jgi:hypothetical protein